MVARSWGLGERGVTADGCGVSFWGDNYSDDGFVSILKVIELCTLSG